MIPIDKMKIIQIEITNACAHLCGNCSRLCGHHGKPFFMDFACFKQGVQSLKGFNGIVGIMGGEPTLHPEFERFVDYYRQEIGFDDQRNTYCLPRENFIEHITDTVNAHVFDEWNPDKTPPHNHRGLWSSVDRQYAKHFELIQDVFGYQCLNDHSKPSRHQPFLVRRKDLGIPDDRWVALRDQCWVQRYWSASITPKGAFFCEVAAALDMLVDGPGGWPVEPGWWRRKPEDFAEQLHWCEYCGAALPLPLRNASSGIDDISPWWEEKLRRIGGKKFRKKRYVVLDAANYDPGSYAAVDTSQVYLESDQDRIDAGASLLTPQKIVRCLHIRGAMPAAEAQSLITASMNNGHVDVVVAAKTLVQAGGDRKSIVLIDAEDTDMFRIMAETFGRDAWVLIAHDSVLRPGILHALRGMVFNPGCRYIKAGKDQRGLSYEFVSLRAKSLLPGTTVSKLGEAFPARKTVSIPDGADSLVRVFVEGAQGRYMPPAQSFLPLAQDGDPRAMKTREAGARLFFRLERSIHEHPDADVIGYCASDTLFVFGDVAESALVKLDRLPVRHAADIAPQVSGWRDDLIRQKTGAADMVVPPATPVRFLPHRPGTCAELFDSGYGDGASENVLRAVEAVCGKYAKAAKDFFHGDTMFHKPIFLCGRRTAFRLCAFMRTLLPLVDCEGTRPDHDGEAPDVAAFLLNIFFRAMIDEGFVSLPLPFALIQDTRALPAPLSVPAADAAPVMTIVSAVNEELLPRFSILLTSLQDVCATKAAGLYDLVVLSRNIPSARKKDLLLQARSRPGISLRFIEIGMLPDPVGSMDSVAVGMLPSLFREWGKILYLPANSVCLDAPDALMRVDLADNFLAMPAGCGEAAHDCGSGFVPLLLHLATIRKHGLALHFAGLHEKNAPDLAQRLNAICFRHTTCFPDQACSPIKDFYASPDDDTPVPTILYHVDAASPFVDALARRSLFQSGASAAVFAESAGGDAPRPRVRLPLPGKGAMLPRTLLERLCNRFRHDLFVAWGLLKSGAFDGPYYLVMNPDVALAKMDPALHYVRYGAREGRNPCDWFNTERYLAANSDVAQSGMNPLYHYLHHGQFENRKIEYVR